MKGSMIPKVWCPECQEGKSRNEKYCDQCGNKLETVTEINGKKIKWDE